MEYKEDAKLEEIKQWFLDNPPVHSKAIWLPFEGIKLTKVGTFQLKMKDYEVN